MAKYYILYLLFACLFLQSCTANWDRWIITTLNIESPLNDNAEITYTQQTYSLEIKTPAAWNISLPEWMSVDKNSGYGNDVVQVTISENTTTNDRKGKISINAVGGSNSSENTIGEINKEIYVTQKGKYQAIQFKLLSAKIDKQILGTYDCIYTGTITYEVISELSNEEIASLVSKPTIYAIARNGVSLADRLTGNLRPTDITKGKHTIEIGCRSQFTQLTSASVHFEYTVTGTNNKIEANVINVNI